MNFLALIHDASFWTGLISIIWVNVILSGDNAVVIALAARALPKEQQAKAVFWGAGAAVVLRILLTWFASELLQLPYLRILGGLLLLWIAVNLLLEGDDDAQIHSHETLFHAIRTILVADLVMSVDNVLAVAAAANGNIALLAIGLALSIPLVIFGASMLMMLMERFPLIITVGAAMIGWVAGDMLVSDPTLAPSVVALVSHLPHFHGWTLDYEMLGKILGAITVLALGRILAQRATKVAVES